MKYTYIYKTSDGVRHEAVFHAESRDEVFAQLRQQGIKPIKVIAADGTKANGEVVIRGVRKRIVALGALSLILGALIAAVFSFRAGEQSTIQTVGHLDRSFLSAQTRRQVIGDAAIIEKGIRTGWADVFEHEGDRFLASFAIPGVKAGQRSTSVEALADCLKEKEDSASHHSSFITQHSLESQQIIAMVEGMKCEARAYLAAGGTIVEYGKRLTERQDTEIAIFKRVESEVLSAQKSLPEPDFIRLYEQRNDELRNLGIRPVTLPE